MCAKVPERFKFSAKLTRTMTHEVKKNQWADILQTVIMPKARSGGIFFNNHVKGQALKNAVGLIRLLSTPKQRQGPWTDPSFT